MLLLPAMFVLALVPIAADSQGQVEWLEQSNRALERDLASARAELLQQAARNFDRREAPVRAEEEGVQSKLTEMQKEVGRLSAMNDELKRLLVAGDGSSDTVAMAGKHATEDEDADAVAREEMHTKVVGSAPRSRDDEMFLLDLAAAKLAEGDLGTAAGLYRSHLALFTGSEAGRAGAARRMLLLMDGHTRSRAGRHLAAEVVSDQASAQVLLDIASELEKGGLLAENRRAASGLLELYLSHHSWAADVWHRLGLLRWRDERLAEAVHCYQLASNLEPLRKEYAASYATANAALVSHPWPPPRLATVFVLQSTASNAAEASALAELQKALVAAGVRAILVRAPPRAGRKSKRNRPKGDSGSSGQLVESGARGQEDVQGEGGGNATLSLPVAQLQAGDIVVFPASRPPPSQWMHAARLRHVLLVSWLFSWRDLVSEGASSGLDAPPHPLWMDWDAGMVAHMMEGDFVKAAGSGGAAHVWSFRAAASHSVLWSSSAPAGALLIPPLPSLPHGVDPDGRFGLMPREQGEAERSRDSHKHDLILCRGARRKCLAALHETLRALPGSGFCPVPLATIANVKDSSPAQDAGLVAGDLVLSVGLVASGLRDVEHQEQALANEIKDAKDHILHVTIRRLHLATIVTLDVTPQIWSGEGLLGWTLEFSPVFQCPDSDVHLFSAPNSASSRPRPLKFVYAPEDLTSEHLRSLLIAAKVLLRQFSWERGGAGDTLGAVELEAALYDVCILVPSDAAAAVDWPIASRLIFEPHVNANKVPTMLLETLKEYDLLSAERGVLKDYIKSLPAALSSASQLLVESAQHLFYTVALDVRDEAAACSFILSARLSHPLATVEVLVRDVQAFYHTHAALVLQLKEKGLWNGVWLSQIPPTALEHASASMLGDAARLHVSLLARPLSLHAGRSYQMACLVDPHIVMVPRAPHGLLDKLSGYSWSSAPYMAWARKGVMRLPLCFRPSALHAKLTRATLSPPAGAESAGKYLYRTMLGVAGFAIHKRLGDTNAIVSSLGVILPSSSRAQDLAQLTGEQSQKRLQELASHPAWAAAQAFLSAERKAVVQRALEGSQGLNGDTGVVKGDEQHGVREGRDAEKKDDNSNHLEQEVRDLRQRVNMLQQKLSEAKQLEQGWQEVAIATERQLSEFRNARELEQPSGGQTPEVEREPDSRLHPSSPRSTISPKGDDNSTDAIAEPAAPASVRVQMPKGVLADGHASERELSVRKVAVVEGREETGRATSLEEAAAVVSSTKVVVISGRAASREHQHARAPDSPLAPSGHVIERAPQPAHSERQQDANLQREGESSWQDVRGERDTLEGSPAVGRVSNSRRSAALVNSTLEEEVCETKEATYQPNTSTITGNSAGSVHERQLPVPSSERRATASPDVSLPEDSQAPRDGPEEPRPPEDALAGRGVVASPGAHQDGQRAGEGAERVSGGGANMTEVVDSAEDAAGASGERCRQGSAVAVRCAEGSRPLTPEEQTLQAAIQRLAREDAEEEGRREASGGDGDESRETPDGSSPAHAQKLFETCPAGYVCSETASMPVTLVHGWAEATLSSDGSAVPHGLSSFGDGESLPWPTPRAPQSGGEGVVPYDAQKGPSGAPETADSQRGQVLSERGEAPNDVVEAMRSAQAAARQRAEILKEGRRMLAARSKIEDVAKRDEEILRAAQNQRENPMLQRAVAAAAEAAMHAPPTKAPRTNADAPTPVLARDSAMHESANAVGGTTLPAGAGDQTAETTIASKQVPSAADCGIGVGVGPAAHGTWKIRRVVSGGSVDRAVTGSSSTPLRVGDMLNRVNGVSLSGMSVSDLSRLVKGPHGSRVVLEFYSLLDSSLHTLEVHRVCE